MGLTQQAGQVPHEAFLPVPEAALDDEPGLRALDGRPQEPVGSGGTGIDAQDPAERPFRAPQAVA